MAEIAGLILGSMGIVGVIGAFMDIIVLFAALTSSADLGRDFEILDIKFDIEKALLLQWSDRVGLVSSGHDERLNDPNIRALVVRTLECISKLVEDVAELQELYGQDTPATDHSRMVTEDGEDAGQETCGVPMGQHRRKRFLRDFKALSPCFEPAPGGSSVTRPNWMRYLRICLT